MEAGEPVMVQAFNERWLTRLAARRRGLLAGRPVALAGARRRRGRALASPVVTFLPAETCV